MTEQELIDRIAEAESAFKSAKIVHASAKMRAMETETLVIESKLKRDRLTEELRVLKSKQVVKGEDYSLFDDE